jgi:hypothetical protein
MAILAEETTMRELGAKVATSIYPSPSVYRARSDSKALLILLQQPFNAGRVGTEGVTVAAKRAASSSAVSER